LVGCGQPSPVRPTALLDQQMDLLAQKAIQWFESQRTAYLAGDLAGLSASIDGKDYDRNLPVKKEWSHDRSTVTVSLPRSDREWFFIELDAQTGAVKESGFEFLNY
jgi:hypothetical protein